jgi:ligand-binding sensor domain-containing protein
MQDLPYQKWVSRIVASTFEMGTVYMTQNGKRDDDFTPYVWKSTNYGKTWVDISNGIPFGPVNVIREDPKNRNILYLGTDGGVYVTTDGAKTWNALGTGLPMTYVLDLVIHPRDNMIVIATHGRGVWVLDANPLNRPKEQQGFVEED